LRYVYSLIRFVPDPARGEFVNVGAIVGSEISSEWQVRQIQNPVRARSIDEQGSLTAVWSFINHVGATIDDFEAATQSLFEPKVEVTEEWLWRLHADHQNVVQISEPTPMLAESADSALDEIFDLMVLDPAARKHSFKNKHTALAALRSAYGGVNIAKGRELCERVTLETSHHSTKFDFAVANGRVVQLARAWSFQVPDQAALAEQVKAWGWTVREAHRVGGRSRTSSDEFARAADIEFEVVYVPATQSQKAPCFVDAGHIFETLGIRAVPHHRANDIAQRARELLGPLSV